MVRLLLGHGARVNARRNDGNTALHLACLQGARDLVQALIDGDADRDAANQAGVTPRDLAKQTRFAGAASLFEIE